MRCFTDHNCRVLISIRKTESTVKLKVKLDFKHTEQFSLGYWRWKAETAVLCLCPSGVCLHLNWCKSSSFFTGDFSMLWFIWPFLYVWDKMNQTLICCEMSLMQPVQVHTPTFRVSVLVVWIPLPAIALLAGGTAPKSTMVSLVSQLTWAYNSS